MDLEQILPEIRFKPVIKRYKRIRDLLTDLTCAGDLIDASFLKTVRERVNDGCYALEEAERNKEKEEKEAGDDPLKAADEDALAKLLVSFTGRRKTHAFDELVWRLAACHDALHERTPVKTSFGPVDRQEWTALMIVQSCFCRLSRSLQPLLDVQFRVLSGTFGGLTFWQPIPHGWFISKLGRELGGGTRERRYPDHRELGGFWLAGRLDTPEPERVRLMDFRATSSALEHNRELRKARKQPCPLKFTHACHECWVGTHDLIPTSYKGAKCPSFVRESRKTFILFERPVHPRHFVLHRCSNCKKESSFEPTHRSRYCVACQAEIIRAHRRF